jgi:hypothetical protein
MPGRLGTTELIPLTLLVLLICGSKGLRARGDLERS